MTNRLLLLPLSVLLGCGSPAEPPPDPAPTPTAITTLPPAEDAELRARGAMQSLGKTLKTSLVSTMKAQGPVAALTVCSTSAQSMTAQVARDHGIAIGRSSLRLRNPDNAGPDWVAAWLQEQGERPAEGVTGVTQRATRTDGTKVVRVLKPLAIEAPCLVCHGPSEERDGELVTALLDTYPSDEASDYALGDLRGAFWAEAVEY
jgi:hypothetical protein